MIRTIVLWAFILFICFFFLWVFYKEGNIGKNNGKEEEDKKEETTKKEERDEIKEKESKGKIIYHETLEEFYEEKEGIKIREIKEEEMKGKEKDGGSKGERICRETLEEFYRKPFKRCRPKWLVNPETKRELEIDCYNEELRIGVEYNGIQHYEWPNFTGQTKKDFIQQVRRDKFKTGRCNQMGIFLLKVPYTVPYSNIKQFIIKNLPRS